MRLPDSVDTDEKLREHLNDIDVMDVPDYIEGLDADHQAWALSVLNNTPRLSAEEIDQLAADLIGESEGAGDESAEGEAFGEAFLDQEGRILDGAFSFRCEQDWTLTVWDGETYLATIPNIAPVLPGEYGVISFAGGVAGRPQVAEANDDDDEGGADDDEEEYDGVVDEKSEDGFDDSEDEGEDEEESHEGVEEKAEADDPQAVKAEDPRAGLITNRSGAVLDGQYTVQVEAVGGEEWLALIRNGQTEAYIANTENVEAGRTGVIQVHQGIAGEITMVERSAPPPKIDAAALDRTSLEALNALFAGCKTGEQRTLDVYHNDQFVLLGGNELDFGVVRALGSGTKQGKVTFVRHRVGGNELRVTGDDLNASMVKGKLRYLMLTATYPFRGKDDIKYG